MSNKQPLLLRLIALRLPSLLLIGGLLSGIGYFAVRSNSQRQVRSDFLVSAQARIQVVQRELEENFGVLRLLRVYFETEKEDGQEAFDHFAGQTSASYRSLRSLEWAPRVRDGDRARFEARLAAQRQPATSIRSSPMGGKLARSPTKSEYFPIQYSSPWTQTAPIGYDVLSDPATALAVRHAIATGEPTSAGRMKSPDLLLDGSGITTLLAVYDAPDKGRDAEWRAQHCRGVVISVIQASELLAAALRSFNERGIRTYVFDISSEEGRHLLYLHPASAASGNTPAINRAAEHSPETLLEEKLVYALKLPAGGREWQIICVGSQFSGDVASWQPLVFLLCGLAVTCAIALYLHMLSRYTRDLADANRVLRTQVEDRQKSQDELAFQAFHDPLTGLPNRRQFSLRFNEAIENAKAASSTLALFFVDLDGFKIINDTLGHAVGDGVLKAVAERFRACVGKNDVVARTGGDEFNILLTEAGTGNLGDRVAQGLLDSLNQPIEVGGRTLNLSASIGISLYPAHGQDFQELAHCSDSAMYVAKKRGKNRFHRYTKELAVTTRRGMELALSLRGAIEREELCLYFQPIVGLGLEPTLRFEALLRWRHPQIGLLGPGHFFSIAEETGLTAPIGKWVLHEACRLAQGWQSPGSRPIGVSVNISGLQFARPEFMESVDLALRESGLRPGLLEIELSESAVVGEIEESLVRLGNLRRKGVTVAVDDFGTGYSSLAYLETLPIDALKIDRSFLPRSESNFRRSSLLRSLIALGRSLNLRVVVGGIEVARQFELVRAMGPNEVQGFLFAKPLASPMVAEFIEQWTQKQTTPEFERLFESVRQGPDLVLVSSRSQAV